MSQVLSILGIGGETVGAAVSEKATRQIGALRRGMFESAAEVDEFNARLVELATEQGVGAIRARGEALESAQTAVAAASGVETGGFSPVLDETVKNNELDALAALIEGKVGASGLRAEARTKRREGQLAEIGAKLEAEATKSKAVSNLFSSAGSLSFGKGGKKGGGKG
jgi:hypothetical protein